MMWTDDPVADADRYEAEKERLLQQLPLCDECGERIQDDSYFVFGLDYYCPDCMEKHRRWI